MPASLDGQNVTAISERGFIGQKLITELVIPESVTSIGGSAFSNCLSLSKVSIEGKLTDVGIYPFYASPFENGLEKKGEYDTTARMGNPECEQIFLRELKPGGLPNLMKYSEI